MAFNLSPWRRHGNMAMNLPPWLHRWHGKMARHHLLWVVTGGLFTDASWKKGCNSRINKKKDKQRPKTNGDQPRKQIVANSVLKTMAITFFMNRIAKCLQKRNGDLAMEVLQYTILTIFSDHFFGGRKTFLNLWGRGGLVTGLYPTKPLPNFPF